MPPLSNERWQIVSPYLDRALDLPRAERASFLSSLRAEDEAIAGDLEALLVAHDELSRDNFLGEDAAPAQPEASLAGLVVGAYTLREPVGQGGMGTVWLADRSDGRFAGTAAVKLLNASLIGHEGEARFKREGNLLARLKHPHIAQLIDAGVSSLGQPYLILEYVDGERIDAYGDRHGLSIEARVRMFLDVLDAVAFAHANLVVHRDLKPANVLVAKNGQVKLLDFGIAKLIATGDGGATLTGEGQAAMTPAYAAPEQLTGGAITTATDVYALGVLLFVLLTGRHPTGGGGGTPADVVKSVVENEPPRGLIRGDLDTIVAKALRKKPDERYASAEAFADDIRRFLAHQPIQARPTSLGYRVAKFVRRNRPQVAAAMMVAFALIAGAVGIAWQAQEARLQRDAALAQLARATATNEFVGSLLSGAAPGDGKFTLTELLERAEGTIDKQFAHDDATRSDLLATIGGLYAETSHWDKAKPLLEKADQVAERMNDPLVRARALCPLAFMTMIEGGDAKEAERMMERALGGLPDGGLYDPQRAECLLVRAQFGFITDEAQPMVENAEKAIAILDRTHGASASVKVDALNALAQGYYLSHQIGKADATYDLAVKTLEASGQEQTITASDTLNNWGILHMRGDVGKSVTLLRRVYDLDRAIEGQDAKPSASNNLANALLRAGHPEEAGTLSQDGIRVARARQSETDQIEGLLLLTESDLDRGETGRAEEDLRQLQPFLGGSHISTNRKGALSYLRGRIAAARGDDASAIAAYGEALDFFSHAKRPNLLKVVTLDRLAQIKLALHDTAAARDAAGKALDLARSLVDKDGPSFFVGLSLLTQGDVEAAGGDRDAAKRAYEEAVRHLQTTVGADHPSTKEAVRKSSA
ncbi:MAG TPA: protein kinase [Candidatus Polarisedimenticolaceae bacterium]|nr:protein kinase [Candidatus Polarisedimenticolaceae bacterium]